MSLTIDDRGDNDLEKRVEVLETKLSSMVEKNLALYAHIKNLNEIEEGHRKMNGVLNAKLNEANKRFEDYIEDRLNNNDTAISKDVYFGDLLQGQATALSKRKLSLETCKKWNYKLAEVDGKPVQVATYYDKSKKPVFQKLRFPNKEFKTRGDINQATLYGQNLWGTKGKILCICEGEIDSLSLSQLFNHKYPVCGIPNGVNGAVKSLKKQLEWIENYEQVAEYKGKVNTDAFSHLIHNTAVQYNNAYIVVENASMGHHVVMKIIEMEYKNMYWTIKDLTKIHEGNSNQLHYDIYNVPKNAVPGFTMSMKSRPACIARLEEDLRTHDFILHSKRTIAELETFIFHNGKPEALASYNDDLVMSLAMGMYVRTTTLRFNSQDEEMTKDLLQGLSFNNTPYEFGVWNAKSQDQEKQWTFDAGSGQKEDMRWLV